MIDIQLSKLMNDVPVGYLTDKLWITKGGAVLPVELNEFAEYELTDNPNKETKSLTYEDYERLTHNYFASLPKRDERIAEPIAKHMAGKHDQRTHAGNRASAESPEFSDSERESIATYSGLAALQINHKLRGLPTKGQRRTIWDLSDAQIETATNNLDAAIDKSSLVKKMTLQREIPANAIKSGLFGTSVGKTISDKGFLSLRNTQDNIPARSGFVKMIVTAPAGTKALDLSFVNPNAMGEIIFPRGTKIKITSVKGQFSDAVVRGEIVE